jgi:hypothetical protein
MKVILTLITLTIAAAAQTVTLQPTQDGDIYSYLDQPTSTIYTLNVSASGTGAPHSNRSLIQFDLSSLGFPAAEIGSAVLRLYAYPPDMGTTGFGNVSIRRQLGTWAPSTLRWNQIQPQEEVALLPVTSANAWVQADVTLVARQWAAGSVANHGLVLMTESELNHLNITFLSMDMPTATFRPQLVISRAAAVQPEVAPALTLATTSAQVVLEWPSSSTGWTLQEADSPAGPWAASSAAPTVVNGKWRVQQPMSARRFFRLSKP